MLMTKLIFGGMFYLVCSILLLILFSPLTHSCLLVAEIIPLTIGISDIETDILQLHQISAQHKQELPETIPF